MRGLSRLLAPAAVPVLLAVSLAAQFKSDEVARRDADEDFLLTARIVAVEPIGEGVTRPFKVTLEKDGVRKDAVWKNPQGMQKGFLEGWRYEIAAYRLDRLVGLNMIPAVVERPLEGKKGALSLWAEHATNEVKRVRNKLEVPADMQLAWNRAKYLSRAWDCLIGNEDRTQQNILYTADWRTILIDHSRAFRSGGEWDTKLIYGARGIKMSPDGRAFVFRQVPRWFIAKLEALDAASIRTAAGPYLDKDEVRSILARRDLLLAEIREMVKAQGEDQVLYD